MCIRGIGFQGVTVHETAFLTGIRFPKGRAQDAKEIVPGRRSQRGSFHFRRRDAASNGSRPHLHPGAPDGSKRPKHEAGIQDPGKAIGQASPAQLPVPEEEVHRHIIGPGTAGPVRGFLEKGVRPPGLLTVLSVVCRTAPGHMQDVIRVEHGFSKGQGQAGPVFQ